MLKFEITRIVESDSGDSHRAIAAVGGTTAAGELWLLSQADAVEGIEDGRWGLFVRGRDGRPIDLVIGLAADGSQYLKGEKDSVMPATLLLLPRLNLREHNLPGIRKKSA